MVDEKQEGEVKFCPTNNEAVNTWSEDQIRFKFKDEFDHPLHESNGGGSDVKVETFVSEKENDNCSEFGDGDDSEDDLDPEKNILVDRTNLLFGKKPIRFLNEWILVRNSKLEPRHPCVPYQPSKLPRLPLPQNSLFETGHRLHGVLRSKKKGNNKIIHTIINHPLKWFFDRRESKTENNNKKRRGIWVESRLAWYFLQDPCTKSVPISVKVIAPVGPQLEQTTSDPLTIPNTGATLPSQARVHITMSAQLGILSYFIDFISENNYNYLPYISERSPDEIHRLLARKFDDEQQTQAFSLEFVRYSAGFLYKHLQYINNGLLANSKFMTELKYMNGTKNSNPMVHLTEDHYELCQGVLQWCREIKEPRVPLHHNITLHFTNAYKLFHQKRTITTTTCCKSPETDLPPLDLSWKEPADILAKFTDTSGAISLDKIDAFVDQIINKPSVDSLDLNLMLLSIQALQKADRLVLRKLFCKPYETTGGRGIFIKWLNFSMERMQKRRRESQIDVDDTGQEEAVVCEIIRLIAAFQVVKTEKQLNVMKEKIGVDWIGIVERFERYAKDNNIFYLIQATDQAQSFLENITKKAEKPSNDTQVSTKPADAAPATSAGFKPSEHDAYPIQGTGGVDYGWDKSRNRDSYSYPGQGSSRIDDSYAHSDRQKPLHNQRSSMNIDSIHANPIISSSSGGVSVKTKDNHAPILNSYAHSDRQKPLHNQRSSMNIDSIHANPIISSSSGGVSVKTKDNHAPILNSYAHSDRQKPLHNQRSSMNIDSIHADPIISSSSGGVSVKTKDNHAPILMQKGSEDGEIPESPETHTIEERLSPKRRVDNPQIQHYDRDRSMNLSASRNLSSSCVNSERKITYSSSSRRDGDRDSTWISPNPKSIQRRDFEVINGNNRKRSFHTRNSESGRYHDGNEGKSNSNHQHNIFKSQGNDYRNPSRSPSFNHEKHKDYNDNSRSSYSNNMNDRNQEWSSRNGNDRGQRNRSDLQISHRRDRNGGDRNNRDYRSKFTNDDERYPHDHDRTNRNSRHTGNYKDNGHMMHVDSHDGGSNMQHNAHNYEGRNMDSRCTRNYNDNGHMKRVDSHDDRWDRSNNARHYERSNMDSRRTESFNDNGYMKRTDSHDDRWDRSNNARDYKESNMDSRRNNREYSHNGVMGKANVHGHDRNNVNSRHTGSNNVNGHIMERTDSHDNGWGRSNNARDYKESNMDSRGTGSFNDKRSNRDSRRTNSYNGDMERQYSHEKKW